MVAILSNNDERNGRSGLVAGVVPPVHRSRETEKSYAVDPEADGTVVLALWSVAPWALLTTAE